LSQAATEADLIDFFAKSTFYILLFPHEEDDLQMLGSAESQTRRPWIDGLMLMQCSAMKEIIQSLAGWLGVPYFAGSMICDPTPRNESLGRILVY
jgi:hypothetical protein